MIIPRLFWYIIEYFPQQSYMHLLLERKKLTVSNWLYQEATILFENLGTQIQGLVPNSEGNSVKQDI